MPEFLFYQRNKYDFDSRELHEASIKELKLKEYFEFNTAWAPSAASVARCHFEGVKNNRKLHFEEDQQHGATIKT